MTDKKVCLITGATNGIGMATAMELARRNYIIFLHGRADDKLKACQAEIVRRSGNKDVHTLKADLAVLDEVRTMAAQFLDTGLPLHCMISNAGVTNTRRQITVDGYEEMFAVNHLAPFLLCNLLLDRIRDSEPARIVIVASGAHAFVKGINFDDLGFSSNFPFLKVYGHSKLANMLFARELAQKLEGSAVVVNSCHPGAVATGLATNNGRLGKFAMIALKPFFRTPEKGAETSIYLADAPDLNGKSGGYYYNCKLQRPKPWATDNDAAKRLWAESASMVGLAV